MIERPCWSRWKNFLTKLTIGEKLQDVGGTEGLDFNKNS